MLVAINDMTIGEHISAEFLSQHIDFIQGRRLLLQTVISVSQHLSGYWIMQVKVPVFVDPYLHGSVSKFVNILAQIHTLKPNRLEAETLSGISLSDRNDAEKVAVWFHTHGLNRLVLSMGDGVYYSELYRSQRLVAASKNTGGERYGGRGCHDDGRAGFLLGW